ncbi:transcriptional regulator family: C2H2 zinc finger and Fungal Specific TF [Aspergillus niger]|nr:transcriptional regulator family: C2H2 zinc finger and Fungal Specific TF [Aspergillus niger]
MGRPPSLVPPCRYCQRQFKRQEHLRRHERTHTREKPCVCECGERFARQDILARHKRSSHKITPIQSEVGVHDPSVIERSGEFRESPSTCPSVAPGHDDSSPRINGLVPTPQDLLGGGTEGNANQPLPWSGKDDLDFLFWNDLCLFSEVLPESSFDPNLSCVNAPQEHRFPPLEQQSSQAIAQGQYNTNDTLPISSTYYLPTPRVPSSPGMRSLFPEPTSNNDNPHLAAIDETDPSQNRQLEGNFDPSISPWKIASSDYAVLLNQINELGTFLPPSFSLPSRYTLSRFLEGFFRGYYDHFPFLHVPSFSILSHGPEIVLPLAAAGAFYRFEHGKGYAIYHAARSLINSQLERQNREVIANLAKTSPGSASTSSINDHPHCFTEGSENQIAQFRLAKMTQYSSSLRLLQGLIVLMTLASWGNRSVVGDAIAISGQVAMLARDLGISAQDADHETNSWENWVEQEERRRTLWVAFAQFNLQSIAFNVPPMILNQEVFLTLPACGEEWKARDARAWMSMRKLHTPDSRRFQQALRQLLQGHQIHKPNSMSAFANYVLLHGLLQEIFFARNITSLDQYPSSIQDGHTRVIETALQAWQNSWGATYESTIDPLSPRGPLGFNARTLLQLAYVRLNVNIGPHRQLVSHNPAEIAHRLVDCKTIAFQRSPPVDRAILQCIHALSIRVRLGVHFIAHTQISNWSMQHSLCNLECAFLLNHWLQDIAQCIDTSGLQTIRDEERKLLSIIYSIVREADLTDLSDWPDDNAAAVRRLAVCTARLWAETYKGHHIFEISRVVGETLLMIADILGARSPFST